MNILFVVLAALTGTWRYTGYNYQGHHYPPTPGLDLRFVFGEDGTANLKWTRIDEMGFCERVATFEVREENWLYQKVVWVNPENRASCGSDPDMQLGRESTTRFQLTEDQLQLDLGLGGDPLIYILERVPTKEKEDKL